MIGDDQCHAWRVARISKRPSDSTVGWLSSPSSRPCAAQQKTATSGLSAAGPVFHGTLHDPLRDPLEKHLRHVKQLTFGGLNAEAYFIYDGRRLIFMSSREPSRQNRQVIFP